MLDPDFLLLVAGFWLVAGLAFEGVPCVRQWRHLAADTQSETPDAARRRVYGQRRALFQWLANLEGVLRVVFWLGLGLLAGLFDNLAVGGVVGVLGFVILFAVGDQLLREILPWARWWFIDRACGVSRSGPAEMASDSARRLALNTTIAALAGIWALWPFALLPFSMAWPLSGLLMICGMAALFWARPNLIDPLFHRFSPLECGELRERLEAMMQRCGTRLEDVLVVDSSRRSNLANAYFTGLGRQKRVVLFDTLIAHLSPAELEAVMAHELGHYRCGHLQRFYGSQALLLLGGYLALGALVAVAGVAVSPVVLAVAAYLLLPALGWPLKPWQSARKRRYEYEADDYAATHAERAALVSALERLLANNLNAPTMDRWYAAVFATHPPGDQRLQALRLKA
ncbi:M48 family peptidase [Salinisphaera dokdonensis CL-ES53]|uniref:M48 family peptidase n=1 Tax=Salinisphaera dokdonensis CL-ES53 TaxID=1304272 RepID=A0ABV2B099_9GAMM